MPRQSCQIFCAVLFTTIVGRSMVCSVEVASQVDLDSDENEQSFNDTVALKAYVNLNEGSAVIPTDPRVTRVSGFRSNSGNDFSRIAESKKRRSHFVQDQSTKPPTIVNNIHIVVNGNDTDPGVSSCKNGVCDVSVSSKPDGAGNIVTDVHLSIVTKLKTSLQVGDIPVVNGFRGVQDPQNGPPTFYPVNRPHPRPNLFNDIPQIQTRHQEPNEPWYHGRRTFQRPQTNWFYHHPDGRTDRRFQGHGGWIPSKPVVDDKIEPPLSKTQSEGEQAN